MNENIERIFTVMDNTPLLLIDGSSFIFRAFHAMPNLTSPDGKPTGATYGVINMLKQLQKKYLTLYWGCVFDTKGITFREEIHPAYKANRAETPADLLQQFEDIYTLIRALGIPVILQEGVEADDIIGTLVIQAQMAKRKVLIATGDKDFAQLVNDNVTLINTMSNETLDINGVVAKFGVRPDQIIDYLSLVGDKVDNIPGVDKCGPKTAAKWLKEYDNLDNIIANANKLTGVVGENLRNALTWLPTAKKLVTINTQIDLAKVLPGGLDQLTLNNPDINLLTTYYTKLGFKSWLRQLQESNPTDIASNATADKLIMPPNSAPKIQKTKESVAITSENQLSSIVDKLILSTHVISILVVPDNYSKPQNLQLICFSDSQYIYIVYNSHQTKKTLNDLFASDMTINNNYLALFNKLLISQLPKILANYKEQLELLTKFKLNIRNVVGDITLAHYIKDSKQNHLLNTVYKDYLDLNIVDIPTPRTKISKNSLMHSQDITAIVNNYLQIIGPAVDLEQLLTKDFDEQQLKLYRDIELPLVKILVDIENYGIMLDVNRFKLIEHELSTQLYNLEHKIYNEAKCVFNINSAKQLQDILFTQLKLPTKGVRKNSNGYSTDEESLKTLAAIGINIANLLLEYRNLSKLLGTYVTKLPKLADAHHRVHTTFEQAVVASGRLSSKDPNLQNIPIKNQWGKQIRQCFIAPPKHKLVCADYSQIELRILAHFSKDENLIQAFNNDLDIHSATASEIFHKPLEQISKDERRYAKTINFSLLYGKTAFGLAQELNIDRILAKTYIDTYFAKYPKVKYCLEQIKQFARENGYVTTLYGRRIYVPNINANNKIIREAEERLALNAPMQGTSADIIKVAMINIERWLKDKQLKTRMILQIHDELILEAPNNEVELVQSNLARLMVENINLSVKQVVDVKIAENWDAAH